MKKNSGKIGNIVTSGSGKKYPKVFNICHALHEIDVSVPTLIVGLQEAKTMMGRNFSILDRRNKERLWWTYTKAERNCEYETDYSDFYNHCLKSALSEIRYRYVDFTAYPISKIVSLLNYLSNRNLKVSFITRDRNFVFVYDKADKIVLGISLTLLEYCGISKDKSIKKLKGNKNNRFVKDTSFMDETLRAAISHDTHYIPVLYDMYASCKEK